MRNNIWSEPPTPNKKYILMFERLNLYINFLTVQLKSLSLHHKKQLGLCYPVASKQNIYHLYKYIIFLYLAQK